MLGKASEIKIQELKIHELDSWTSDNPNTEILDIKYDVSSGGWSYILIIYKEAKEDE